MSSSCVQIRIMGKNLRTSGEKVSARLLKKGSTTPQDHMKKTGFFTEKT